MPKKLLPRVVATAPLVPFDQRLAYNLDEAAQLLGCTERWLREQHKNGRITIQRDGRRAKISRDELLRYQRELPERSTDNPAPTKALEARARQREEQKGKRRAGVVR